MPLPVLHLLFFLSGATALVYEVTWVRSLTLVFGGSHLAVTTVLTVFMSGLALGGALLGRRADTTADPLRLYGKLELGIGALALFCLALSAWYPSLYVPLARWDEENPVWLTLLRFLFAMAALLGPCTLMGGTLPVLVRLLSQEAAGLGRHLSRLYAINTLGAVAGTAAAGFVLLPQLGAAGSQWLAIGTNFAIGLAALMLRLPRLLPRDAAVCPPVPTESGQPGEVAIPGLPVGLVLFGAGLAGFCSLGYEVLWTRTLALVVGTSVYSFTIILIAFLLGIAGGSQAFGMLHRRRPWRPRTAWLVFGLVHLGIAGAACAITVWMRDLTFVAPNLQERLGGAANEFTSRQMASLLVALSYMIVPALLLGAAFPLAGALVGRLAAGHRGTGRAVGSVLAWNTVGAVLGASVTGFWLAPTVGYERSLHVLAALGAAFGLLSVLQPFCRGVWKLVPAGLAVALPLAVAFAPEWLRTWDPRDIATFMNNTRWAYTDEATAAATRARFEVLYFHEGTNETISVLRRDDGLQSFVVNGRPEASTGLGDVQLQYLLGHLPALLHRAPKSAFVLGTGAGMTLGAVAAHEAIERVVLAEIEPRVLPATRTFGDWNHQVLDSGKLHVVFNDGRNHLATTREQFDVITADPIHPWAGGAAYLYTREYFHSMRTRLNPGGVASQWLPLYELSPFDVKTVARTWSEQFEHVALFVTWWDAVLIGSDRPLDLDEVRIGSRLGGAAVSADLEKVGVRTARDVLAFFVLGDTGMRTYAADGGINTDDNLLLEFSSPRSMGVFHLIGDNLEAIARHRESLLGYLPTAADEAGRQRRERWARDLHEAGQIYDRAHTHLTRDEGGLEPCQRALVTLMARYPTYAPYRFLKSL